MTKPRGSAESAEPPSTETAGRAQAPGGGRRSRTVTVRLQNDQEVPVDGVRLKQRARAAAESEGAWGELFVKLVTSEEMADLNGRHMGKSGPTDVLSFPIDGLVDYGPDADLPDPLIGDVIVCPEVAARQAPEDPAGELDLLVTHGVLHLLGYDHDTEAAAAAMRGREFDLIGRSGAQA